MRKEILCTAALISMLSYYIYCYQDECDKLNSELYVIKH